MKRSSQVALLLMGTVAVGGGAYALMPSENCQPNQPGLAQPGGVQNQNCNRSWRGSSGGGSGGYYGSSSSSSSRYLSSQQNFAGSGTSSGGSSSTSPGSSGVARGGFGSFASHFSGGG
jgi:hypothetical protein